MEALISLAVAVAFSYACAGLLKKAPWVFYVMFALVGALFVSGAIEAYVPALNLALVPYLRRAPLAFGIFSVVMFIGVFPEGSSVRKRLAPIRGTLSLLGFILIVVHVLGYAATYWAPLTSGTGSPWIKCGLIAGIIVSALLVILAITSLTPVRKAMNSSTWSRVQKLAYPFYLLMYVHLGAMLAPSSLAGGNSFFSLVVYTAVVVAYIVLRLFSYAKSRK